MLAQCLVERFDLTLTTLASLGASLEASYALHCCAYTRQLQQLEMLLRMVPNTAVNQPDSMGLSPLMLAAQGACGVLSTQVQAVPTEAGTHQVMDDGGTESIFGRSFCKYLWDTIMKNHVNHCNIWFLLG